ncbi:hypothetical protein ACRZ5S_19570 [Vibrio scophthalmi]|uniref:hypothetical protein n=1 Tax=Vibrio scophthalmi TaxID=45658 RepID=UPI003EC07217
MTKQNYRNIAIGCGELCIEVPNEVSSLFWNYFPDAVALEATSFNYRLPEAYLNRLNQFFNEIDELLLFLEEQKTKTFSTQQLRKIHLASSSIINNINKQVEEGN